MEKWLMSISGVCLVGFLAAQPTLIQWSNPSFEDVPGPARPPLGWYFCGPPTETPPDVHPVLVLNVTQAAKHGKTYAGLVVRDNNTQETLGQALETSLEGGQCYLLRLYACRSSRFSSYSRRTGLQADFSEPIKLQLWAGNQHCEEEALLAETPPIRDTTWTRYEVKLSPQTDYRQLFFTAAYAKDSIPYNGHLLLDHLSPIIPIDCTAEHAPSEDMIFEIAEPETGSDDLKSNIERALQEFHWVRDGFSLEQQLLPVQGSPQAWTSGNKVIHQITAYLNNYSDVLLTVAVGPKKDPLLQHHIRLLAAEFMAAGLSPDRCLIRPLRKKDLQHHGWLNTNFSEQHVLWGVN